MIDVEGRVKTNNGSAATRLTRGACRSRGYFAAGHPPEPGVVIANKAVLPAGIRAASAAMTTPDIGAGSAFPVEEGERGGGEERGQEDVVMREAGQDRQRVTALRPALAHPATVA
jgi:hypothetical protein